MGLGDINLEIAIKTIIKEIKSSEEYRKYIQQKELIKQDAEVLQKVDELRSLNFELQNAPESFDDSQEEQLEDRIEELYEDSRLNDYMQAEIDFCKLFQNILSKITQGIDFE
ncbi:MAG: YlbF family regulator [Clostridia bacterium]|nr:YlbF family regulator [Clostridia bacterium]